MKSYSFDITLQYASQVFLSTKLCHIISINVQNKFRAYIILLLCSYILSWRTAEKYSVRYTSMLSYKNILTMHLQINTITTTFLPILHVCSIMNVQVSTVWHVFQLFMTSLAGCFSYLMSCFKITPNRIK